MLEHKKEHYDAMHRVPTPILYAQKCGFFFRNTPNNSFSTYFHYLQRVHLCKVRFRFRPTIIKLNLKKYDWNSVLVLN